MKNRKMIGAVVATAVAGLFLAGRAIAAEEAGKKEEAKIHCSGINACSGKGGCKSADNACKGKNGCKGKGWVEVKTEKECTDKSGKVMAAMEEKKETK